MKTTTLVAVFGALVGMGCATESESDPGQTPDAGFEVTVTKDVAETPDAPSDAGEDLTEPDTADVEPDIEPDTGPIVTTIALQEVQPPFGHPPGSETVAILGDDLNGSCQVLFDGSPGEYVIEVTPERLHVNTPPHPPGVVDVTVVCGDRSGTLEGGFTYFDEVTVTAVSPAFGPRTGGTPVTITGRGFQSDSLLVFGSHKALDTVVIDDRTLLAVTPPGPAGPVQVTVSNDRGVGSLNQGFRYQAGVIIDVVVPPTGPDAGGTVVELRGSGLQSPTAVWFGGKQATALEAIDDTRLLVTTPAGTGAVDLLVMTADGDAVVSNGFEYTNAPAALVANPSAGTADGGTLVALHATSVDASDIVVTFGSAPATVIDIVSNTPAPDVGPATIVVESPAGSAGPTTITLTSAGSSASADWTYLPSFRIDSLSPNAGPEVGGTAVTLTGAGFQTGTTPIVQVGARTATDVTVLGQNQLSFTTPAGTPGRFDVRVRSGDRQATLVNGFEYTAEKPELWVVLPNRGAIAGNTWVQLIGAGLEPGSTVQFGELDAVDVQWQSPGLITCRTPPATKGTVPVTITGPNATTSLEKAFTFYNPKTTFGGTSGGPMNGSVNVTVLDGLTAQPVEAAFVIVGKDGSTPHQGLTNSDGQLTLSGPELFGTKALSISKEGYVTYSVVHFDADSVTVFLKQIAQPDPALPNSALPALVTGKVSGLGKYVAGIPGQCLPSSADPIHCDACIDPEDCGDGGAVCADLGVDQGSRCLMPCAETAECPEDHECQEFGEQKACFPLPGEKVSVCTSTKPGYRILDIPIGEGAMADEDGNYTILAWPTEIAVVCFGGFWIGSGEPTSAKLEDAIKDNPSGRFQPMVMGVARHLLLSPAQIENGIDVELNIPLSRTVRARVEKPPFDDTDYLWTLTFLDFGEDGVVRMPVVEFIYDDEPMELEALPESLTNIEDASYIFYSSARSYTNSSGFTYPRSYVVRTGITEPQDDRMLRLVDGAWQTPHTGLVESLLGAYRADDEHIVAVGTGGVAFRYVNGQHLSMPTPTKKTLRAVHGTAADNVWAVGDDGMVLRHNGVAWSKLEAPTNFDLRAVYVADDQTVRAAGQTGVWRLDPGGDTWTREVFSGTWNAMDGTSAENLWMVGTWGSVRRRTDSGWSTLSTPTSLTLNDVAVIAPNNVWMVGDSGTILRWNGTDMTQVPSGSTEHLYAVEARTPIDVAATGAYGTVLNFDGTAWVKAPTGDYAQDLHALVMPPQSSDLLTFGGHQLILGPIAAPARIESPIANATFEGDKIVWSADPRVEAHYQLVEILVPGMFAPTLIWELMVDGSETQTDLPDLGAISGTPGLQEGQHYVSITRVYQPGFDIDNFNYAVLGNIDRESWAVEFIGFQMPVTPDEEPETP